MAKPHRLLASIAAVLLLSVATLPALADNTAPQKGTKKGDDKSFSTFVNYLKSNYDAKGQNTFGMVNFARFLVKVIKPAGVKNFKVSMLRDLQFTNLKVDDDLGAFIRKNVHADWHPMTQVVSLKNQQYVYVYFMPEKNDVKFLVVAVNQKDAFVVQFKFEPERLAKFIENPEILGISLTGDDDKRHGNYDPGDPGDPGVTTDSAGDTQNTDKQAQDGTLTEKSETKPEAAKAEGKPLTKPDTKSEAKPEVKPEAKSETKPEAKAETKAATPAKKPPVLIRKDNSN